LDSDQRCSSVAQRLAKQPNALVAAWQVNAAGVESAGRNPISVHAKVRSTGPRVASSASPTSRSPSPPRPRTSRSMAAKLAFSNCDSASGAERVVQRGERGRDHRYRGHR